MCVIHLEKWIPHIISGGHTTHIHFTFLLESRTFGQFVNCAALFRSSSITLLSTDDDVDDVLSYSELRVFCVQELMFKFFFFYRKFLFLSFTHLITIWFKNFYFTLRSCSLFLFFVSALNDVFIFSFLFSYNSHAIWTVRFFFILMFSMRVCVCVSVCTGIYVELHTLNADGSYEVSSIRLVICILALSHLFGFWNWQLWRFWHLWCLFVRVWASQAMWKQSR